MPNFMNAPIPGQSLTQDPSSRGPWEMPPKFNTVNQSIDHLFKVATSKSFIQAYDKLLQEDRMFYVDSIVYQMLSEGFINGLWTVDTMILLVEPLTALLVWVAAQLDETVSFSTDSGYEDRTGFEGLMEELESSEIPPVAPEVSPEAPESVPAGQPAQQSPLVPQGPQSPLVTGGM